MFDRLWNILLIQLRWYICQYTVFTPQKALKTSQIRSIFLNNFFTNKLKNVSSSPFWIFLVSHQRKIKEKNLKNSHGDNYNPLFITLYLLQLLLVPHSGFLYLTSCTALDKLRMNILNFSRAVQLTRYRNPMRGTKSIYSKYRVINRKGYKTN